MHYRKTKWSYLLFFLAVFILAVFLVLRGLSVPVEESPHVTPQSPSEQEKHLFPKDDFIVPKKDSQNPETPQAPGHEEPTLSETLKLDATQLPDPSTTGTTPVVVQSSAALDVPFTSQAPFKVWDEVHEELCEEAAMLMATAFARDEEIGSLQTAENKLQEVKVYEENSLGYWKDTTVEENAAILKDHFHLTDVHVLNDPTLEDYKQALSSGRIILVPTYGRSVPNPYFTPPGPVYHFIVLRGYNESGKFLVRDPGSTKSKDIQYSFDVVMKANHDWNDGDVQNGKRSILIVGKNNIH